ncbi:MAG: hypothetical protein ACSHXK_13565 [Oceanococcus sp.]
MASIRKHLGSVCLGLAAWQGAQAASPELTVNDLLFTVDTIKVVVYDQVRNGCMPQPNAIKKRVEATLTQHGFTVLDAADNSFVSSFAPYFSISALGFAPAAPPRQKPRCIVHVESGINSVFHVSVPYSAELPDGPLRPRMRIDISYTGSLLEGSRHGMQARLETAAVERTEKFVKAVASARQVVQTRAPALWNLYAPEMNAKP